MNTHRVRPLYLPYMDPGTVTRSPPSPLRLSALEYSFELRLLYLLFNLAARMMARAPSIPPTLFQPRLPRAHSGNMAVLPAGY